jgi:hypothetical protein
MVHTQGSTDLGSASDSLDAGLAFRRRIDMLQGSRLSS